VKGEESLKVRDFAVAGRNNNIECRLCVPSVRDSSNSMAIAGRLLSEALSLVNKCRVAERMRSNKQHVNVGQTKDWCFWTVFAG
jgi:hypothetical protein